MPKEEKQGTTEQQEAESPSLESLLEESPDLTPQPPKQEEEKAEEPAKKGEEEVPKKSEKAEEKPETKEEPEVEKKPESDEKAPAKETEKLTEDQKKWKQAFEDKGKWQKSLTHKSQLINAISDEEVSAMQGELKLRKEMKDVKVEPLPEFIDYETVDAEGDKISVKLPKGKIQEIVDKHVEAAKQAWVKEMGPVLQKGEVAVVEAQRLQSEAHTQAALTGIEKYFEDFPDSGFSFGDDPILSIQDIQEAGATHPDYDKLLNLNAVAERSKAKGITMKEAHIEIFGKSDQQQKAKDKIKEEQQLAQEEKPGQTTKTVTEDEKFDKTLGIGAKKDYSIFD